MVQLPVLIKGSLRDDLLRMLSLVLVACRADLASKWSFGDCSSASSVGFLPIDSRWDVCRNFWLCLLDAGVSVTYSARRAGGGLRFLLVVINNSFMVGVVEVSGGLPLFFGDSLLWRTEGSDCFDVVLTWPFWSDFPDFLWAPCDRWH